MRAFPRFVLAVAGLVFAATAAAARPTLAVLPFNIDKQVVITDGYHILSGTIEDQTALLSNELLTQLVATRKFDVLERARLNDLLDEKDLQASDYGSAGSLAKVAKVTGADYLVLGRIERIGAGRETKPAMAYSSRTYTLQKAWMDLYLRVVDAKSGRIVAAEKFVKEVSLRDPKPTDSLGQTLLAATAQEGVSRLVEAIFPLRVAKVDGTVLYLNRSSAGALAVGDRLAIQSQGEAVRDNDTGEEIGRAASDVAQARVTAVDGGLVKAELTSAGAVKEGMLVKKLPPESKKPDAPADLPPGPRW
jgi:curli biogenesis system outer membrane secretion channel CsgG